MSQAYSDPNRESETYSLPDVETFRGTQTECKACTLGGVLIEGSRLSDVECLNCGERRMRRTSTKLYWYYWFCFPGCLPDSEPFGPFKTEALALADAQNQE